MTRIVVDTNVLISAAIKPDGLEAKVLALCTAQTLSTALSDALEAEYREVASRKKFARQTTALSTVIDALVRTSRRVTVDGVSNRCKDPKDDMVLACAIAARARFLVTGNVIDFPGEADGVRVLNARALLAELDAMNP